MAKVVFEDVQKLYPDGTQAIFDFDLRIDDGEFVILVGPSGCGKSTALRMVAGLEEISGGKLYIGDRVVNDLSPKDRDIAMVFQSYALYPHMSVADNMGFALKLAKIDKAEIDRRVRNAAETLGLTDFLHRKPKALSGGQRQRVAMGRAIVRSPQAFLMDEPLSNLDAKLRVQMRAEIAALQNRLGVTTVYVTHDQIEAMTMGDRVAVLKAGRLMQVDSPQQLYDSPDNLFVAGFIGSPAMNIAEVGVARLDDAGGTIALEFDEGRSRLTVPDAALERYPRAVEYAGRKVAVGIRPEHFLPADEVASDQVWKGRRVELVELLGSEMLVHFHTDSPPIVSEDMKAAIDDEDAFEELERRAAVHDAASFCGCGRFAGASRGSWAASAPSAVPHQESSGNTIEVEVSPDFETQIVSRVTGGNAPDVALYPQPGLLERMVDQGGVVPLADAGVDVDALTGELVPGMVDTGTFDDETHGVVVKLAMKSLLWYPPTTFEDAGYEVPETWDALLELTSTIAEDTGGESGRAPWCIGIEDGGSTGWVATDWIEDIMLRLHGPDVYDQWVSHELPFASDEVREAFEHAEEIWFDEQAVLGGTTGMLQTPFGDSPSPMFDDPPGCMLHRQAGFIVGFFPEGAELGSDYATAYLPPIDESVGSPVLFAGDVAAVHTDNPVAGEFVEFMASAEGQEAWMSHEGAGALAVRTDFDPGTYPSEDLSQQGEFLANADFARFDGSDLMPGEVGAGAFWTEMVAWISGSQDLDTTLQNIDAAWPS